MIKVAHVMRWYLAQPETFIWQYLHKFERVYPVVIAETLQNLSQFPLPAGKVYRTYGPRLTQPWLMDNWYRRVLKRPLGFMERIMRREGVRVVHAHFGPMGCKCLPVALSLRIPLITNYYGYDLSMSRVVEQNKAAYVELFRRGHHFLVEGPRMRERLISLGCSPEKVSIQRIAIDLEQYTFNPPLAPENRSVRLLFVGRMVEKKGLEYALRALAKIKEGRGFQFRIIGSGELEKSLRLLALDLGLSEKVEWLGMQPHRKVIEELRNCHILIQPSVTAKNGDSEGGAPTTILEAQACGVPVVSTLHADIPYVTRPDESALLAPERDVEHLSENVRYLMDHPETWSRMGKMGRQHVEQFHDVAKEVVTLE
ncbi:glycosyltransferase, partial [Thermodesulfobacteriota bacterium]